MTYSIDYSTLNELQIDCVRNAISAGEEFYRYIPEVGFQFILSNYKTLAKLGVLERNWMLAYTHESHFAATSMSQLQCVFDACSKEVLQKFYPICAGDDFSNGERFSLFRGCAGPNHRRGFSWTASLDKAIWYAAHHAEYYGLDDVAVYTTVVRRDEIYCCGNHYDFDYIVYPRTWWKINIPRSEFRLDRPR